MKLIKYKLGDLIRQRRQKNDSSDLPICGVTRDGFIPPKQQDADTSLYNVFYLKDFVFNPARMELNAIVFNDRYEKAICSSLYEVFYVHRPDVILPEYLALLVKQDWFTRYCEFMGSGSAREYCRVANISELEIEVPPIEFQAEMARDNQIIRDRIELKRRINDNLAAQMRAYFKEYTANNASITGKLKDYSVMQYGYTETATTEPVGPKFLRITDIAQNYIDWNGVPYCPISEGNHEKYVLSEGDVVVARTGATVGYAKMVGRNIPDSVFASFLVRIRPIDDEYRYYFGLAITSSEFLDFVQTNAGGSAQPQANPPLLGEFELSIPNKQSLPEFNTKISSFLGVIESNETEISKLHEVKDTMVKMLSSQIGRASCRERV